MGEAGEVPRRDRSNGYPARHDGGIGAMDLRGNRPARHDGGIGQAGCPEVRPDGSGRRSIRERQANRPARHPGGVLVV